MCAIPHTIANKFNIDRGRDVRRSQYCTKVSGRVLVHCLLHSQRHLLHLWLCNKRVWHTYKHAKKQTYIHIHVCIHEHMHGWMHTYIHTHLPSFPPTHPPTNTHGELKSEAVMVLYGCLGSVHYLCPGGGRGSLYICKCHERNLLTPHARHSKPFWHLPFGHTVRNFFVPNLLLFNAEKNIFQTIQIFEPTFCYLPPPRLK